MSTSTSHGGAGAGKPKKPSDAHSPDECSCDCVGGQELIFCDEVTVELSQPVPRDGLDVVVETSDGDVYDTLCDDYGCDWPFLAAVGDPVAALVLRTPYPDTYPSWLTVSLTQNGTPIGSGHLGPLSYACHAITGDDWCWNAAPVQLEVTPVP